MKSATFIAAMAASAAAFPHMDMLTAPLRAEAVKRVEEAKRQISSANPPQGAGALPLTPPPFSAASQYVSTTGQYAFVPPGPTDARGECPGLNAMANHGYLPHNGVATIEQFTTACQQVFGMGADLAAFLAVFGAVVDGSGTSWSIDGLPHTGIGGSHGNYEVDSSPLKADLNQYGNLDELVISQYKTLVGLQPNANTANYNLEVLREFRAIRFNQSVAENPYFTYGPFTGIAVSQAAFTFIYRFMSNKSAEYPEGVLSLPVLNSFMAIDTSSGQPVWTKGYERIPNNWYKRNTADAYTIPYFISDILYFGETVPQILDVGCNMGTVNSYNSIPVTSLSSGAYTPQSVAKSPFCFAAEYAKASLPALNLASSVLAPLLSQFSQITSNLGCTPITAANTNAFSVCPGETLYGGPTGPIAPGAIQN